MTKEMDLTRFLDPFDAFDLEFMSKSVSKKWEVIKDAQGKDTQNANGTGLALTYITSRAIMDRLDEVCGAGNWRNEFKPAPDKGVLCGISILINGEWITKWDGAENTNIEAVKGGLSGAMKRAGSQWGMGRYLYDMPDKWIKGKVYTGGKSPTITFNEAELKTLVKYSYACAYYRKCVRLGYRPAVHPSTMGDAQLDTYIKTCIAKITELQNSAELEMVTPEVYTVREEVVEEVVVAKPVQAKPTNGNGNVKPVVVTPVGKPFNFESQKASMIAKLASGERTVSEIITNLGKGGYALTDEDMNKIAALGVAA